jgi:DNA-binding response OmpR family regulator
MGDRYRSSPLARRKAAGAGRTARVLVVEDAPDLAEVIALLVESEGHAVTVAPTLDDARRTLERDAVDVVLLDLWVGESDGKTLLPSIRAAAPGAKVIVTTGASRSDVSAWARREGLSFAPKPFDGVELLAEIEGHVAPCIQSA